jgi:uncharacterized protein (TIGR02996 family)
VIDTERGLLNAILIHPHDDMTRLVFADWLTENGQDERAEFIRLQCELDAVAPYTDTDQTRREAELLESRGKEWFGECEWTNNREWFDDPNSFGDGPARWGLVRRGFLTAIAAPLAWLIGGECDGCDNGPMNTFRGCPYCHGTGRTPGYLPELVRTQPITRVVVTDKTPFHLTASFDGRHRWAWYDSPRRGSRFNLPYSVFTVLRGADEDWSGTGSKRYFSEHAALDALSDALIHVAKFGDKKPVKWDGGRCRWSSDAIKVPLFSVRQHPEAILPAAIFDRLSGYDPKFVGHGHKFYDDTDAAYAALWEAIVTA